MGRGSRDVAEWESLVAAYRRDGLSQVEFARRHGVGLGELQRWVRRVQEGKSREREERTAGVRAEAVGFVRVQIAERCGPPTAAREQVEAELPRGVRLRFSAGAPVEGVAALIAATVERLGC